jgi:hypothetical protein
MLNLFYMLSAKLLRVVNEFSLSYPSKCGKCTISSFEFLHLAFYLILMCLSKITVASACFATDSLVAITQVKTDHKPGTVAMPMA